MARSTDDGVADAARTRAGPVPAPHSVTSFGAHRVVALSGGLHPLDSGAGAQPEHALGEIIAASPFLGGEHGTSLPGLLLPAASHRSDEAEPDGLLVHLHAHLAGWPRICVRNIQCAGERWVCIEGGHGV